MDLENSQKFQQIGQFYTEKNVFNYSAFKLWWKKIPSKDKKKVLEPFAGKNGIIDMLKDIQGMEDLQYYSYDITPGHKDVQYQDTIENFPQGFNVCITNPPFLAKNSATRRKIPITIEPFSDLYELCLHICLQNLDYLAIIIPESFITSPHFKNRLFAVISLTEKKIFKETEQPVCLALFTKKETPFFHIYRNELYLGQSNQLKEKESKFFTNITGEYEIFFHKKEGQLGFLATDATKISKKMKLVRGQEITDQHINNLTRLQLKILINKNNKPIKVNEKFIKGFNQFLNDYRESTHDTGLTAFKGLREDGLYRRRMSFLKLKQLLYCYLNEVNLK